MTHTFYDLHFMTYFTVRFFNDAHFLHRSPFVIQWEKPRGLGLTRLGGITRYVQLVTKPTKISAAHSNATVQLTVLPQLLSNHLITLHSFMMALIIHFHYTLSSH